MVGKGEPAAVPPVPRDGDDDDEETAGFVKLISAEGFEFVVDKKAAMVSNTLRNMLTSPGKRIISPFPSPLTTRVKIESNNNK
jgi:elongin-C